MCDLRISSWRGAERAVAGPRRHGDWRVSFASAAVIGTLGCGFAALAIFVAAPRPVLALPGGSPPSRIAIPFANTRPGFVAAAPDGAAWFSDSGTDQIGRVARDGGLTFVRLRSPSGPAGIAVDAEGGVWVAQNDRNAIAWLPPGSSRTSDLVEYFLPVPGSQPYDIAVAADGSVWFTEIATGVVGQISADGDLREHALANPLAAPAGIDIDAAGNVWFAQFNANRVGRIDPDGHLTEVLLRSAESGPLRVAAHPDGSIWISQFRAGQVARIEADGTLTEFPLPDEWMRPVGIGASLAFGVFVAEVTSGRLLRGSVAGFSASVGGIALAPGAFASGNVFGAGVAIGVGNELWIAEDGAGSIRHISLCLDDAACVSANCELHTLTCSDSRTPTASTPTASHAPTRVPTATATAMPSPSGIPTSASTPLGSVSPTSTATPAPSATAFALATVPPAQPRGSHSSGCAIGAEPSGPAWLWLAIGFGALRAAARRMD